MRTDLLLLPPIGIPQGFAPPVRVCPVELAVAIGEGLELLADYERWRQAHNLPPSTLPVLHFICAVAPEHLQPAILRWLDEMLIPSLPH